MATPSFTEYALYRRLLRQARPYWPHLGGLFLLSLLVSPLALLTPLPLKMAVDSVVGSHRQIPGPLAALLPEDQDTRWERDGLDLVAWPVDHGQSGIPSIFFTQEGVLS